MLVFKFCTCASLCKTTWDSVSFTCEAIYIFIGTPTDEGPALAVRAAEHINKANV